MRFSITLILLIVVVPFWGNAQVSPDCSTAIPICNNTPVNGKVNGFGIDDFNGSSVSGCIANATGTVESNSSWYRFKIGENGQLGFNIGFDVSEDWDFALYRTDDCSTLGEPIRCNYFDNSDSNSFIGLGEDPTGSSNFQYEDWLQVSAGEEYYLLLNNFSDNNSGFSIQFSGTIFNEFPNTALDCSVIDNLLGSPISACEYDTVVLEAATDEALVYEWYLDIGVGYQRIPGEHLSELNLAVSGFYRVLVVMPSGENILSEVQVVFSPAPFTNSLIDEMVCLDGTIVDLSAKNIEALGDESANEFRISYHSSQLDANLGLHPLSKEFEPTLDIQTIYVRNSSLVNPDCYDTSESFQILGKEVPLLDFTTQVFICKDTPIATLGQRVPEANYDYTWDSGQTSSQITVTKEGTYTLSATNSQNGLSCSTVRSVTVVFSEAPEILDVSVDYTGNTNQIRISLKKEGRFEFQVDDGEPQNSNVFSGLSSGLHTVSVRDVNGCGIDIQEIVIVGFPKFFTPNGDGINDLWAISGLGVLGDPVVFIYDRFGVLLYQMDEDSKGWDGSFNGMLLSPTDYWFQLTYVSSNGNRTQANYINNHFSLKF